MRRRSLPTIRKVSPAYVKQQISLGIIGCGYWGPNLIRNFNSLPNCAIRGMCDVNEKRLKHLCTLYSDIPAMTDYQQLLRLRGLEAVVIATPVKHHFSLAKASLLAGMHTFIEKPMASSSAEC